MQRQFYIFALVAIFSAPLHAAPGSLSQVPLFIASPTQPNIFFMLDDSGSMDWNMPADGLSGSNLISMTQYDTTPNNNDEWRTWCAGANLLAYNSSVTYIPWAANIPGTNTPFPDQTDITRVQSNPLYTGSGYNSDTSVTINNDYNYRYNLSEAPVVQWTDSNSNGTYDNGECPTSFGTHAKKASSLSQAERTNFANWFSYYRSRERTAKSAVTQVISTSSARMGMATLHHNNGVGKAITNMAIPANKQTLLSDIVNITSSGGTPLRNGLNWVGQYFDNSSSTPSSLNLGNGTPKPILSDVDGGSCQQNFAMLMTDGQWNGSDPSNIGHQDKDIDNVYVWPAHRDTNQKTLADVAMKWFKTDLAPSLSNDVPVQKGSNTQNLDENNQQHLVTFGVAFGATGTLTNDPTDRTQNFTWPNPKSDKIETVDDLRHAAYNGRGMFLSASKPEELISALQNVITNIESRAGSSSAVAFNMSTLSTDTLLFFAGFNPTNWTGNLDAYSLDPSTGDLSSSPAWSAATLLDARTNTDMVNNRVIYTMGTDAAGIRSGVLLNSNTTNPQPASNTRADLKTNADLSTDVSPFAKTLDRLKFIRGDKTNNGVGLIRDRLIRLGDIVNSAPLYIPETSSAALAREAMVYVGANDGFLHGFSATSGQELMAYAPSAIASSLDNSGIHYLTESDYQHRYYVDGEVVSADVNITKGTATASWRTALVGSLRGGGQGIFALDVTQTSQYSNTQASAKSTVLWEFTDQDDPVLGFTYSTPEIVLMNNNEWAVITGNGYNASGTNTAQLMIIFIDKGIDGQWSAGDYIKIDTATGDVVNKNGLSTPTTIDLDNNGTTDRIYAGDILGNMWAFDVSDASTSNWKIAHAGAPLFSAGNTKPITMKPLLSRPEATWIPDSPISSPNIMVYFGTGQYIASGDPASIDQQSFFGIWDSGVAVQTNTLVQQTFLSANVAKTRLLSQNSVAYGKVAPLNSGWFINLPESGERVVVNAIELEGLIFFNTMTPSEEACSSGGSSWLMSVDKKTGGTPSIVSFDFNRDGFLTVDDTYAAGIQFEYGIASKTSVLRTTTDINYGYTSGTDNSGKGASVKKEIMPGSALPATGARQSWIQLINN
tara:strand:- start:36002 stop:39343 length:3342 start_codon:yes stop_codon:yes gene_type:complete